MGVDLGEILCVQEERCVGNDNCVTFNRLKLPIPESPLRAHFKSAGRPACGNVDKANALPTALLWPFIKLRLTEPLASFAHRTTKPEEADI
jgi:hypothetical protein